MQIIDLKPSKLLLVSSDDKETFGYGTESKIYSYNEDTVII